MTAERTRTFRRLLFAMPLALACGCGARDRLPDEPRTTIRERRERSERRRREAEDEIAAVRINRTLLYDVQWSRAEDVAATLEPLVANLYGPGAVVIPHVATNKLFIYIPTRREREALGGGGTATQPTARPSGRSRGATRSTSRSRTGSRAGRRAATPR